MATVTSPVPVRKPRWRRLLRKLILYAAVPYLFVVVLLGIFQRSLIYAPTRAPKLPASQAALPKASAESIMVSTPDGLELNGWLFTSHAQADERRKGARREWARGKPLVLYFCGNAGHRGFRMQEFDILTAWGADVLCCDYRGYGDNPGSPSEAGLAVDARAVWDFAVGARDVSPHRIVIVGESLGGGVATRLAAEVCAEGRAPAGLVLRSTFSSLTDVAADAVPWVPVRWLLLDRYPSAARIPQVTCPLLMLHGQRDTIVPHEFGRRLFAAAPDQSSGGMAKRLIDLPTANHNDVLEMEGVAFERGLRAFLDEVCPRRAIETPQGAMFERIERRLIYFPVRAESLSPARVGLPADRVHPIEVVAGDGIQLNGWHVLSDGHTAATRGDCDRELAQGRPLILFFSGNGGNRAFRVPEIEVLTSAGADVFLFDYRGYGDNAGEPSEAALAADAQAVWKYAVGERHVPPARIVLYGESLGGGVATRLAAEVCKAGSAPGGLVLRSTFTSLADAAVEHYSRAVRLLLSERYASIERIPLVTCPILILHGTKDTIVPYRLGQQLFDAAPERSSDATPKRIVALPHSDHNDVLDADGGVVRAAVREFMERPMTPPICRLTGRRGP